MNNAETDILATRIFLRAVMPLIKTVLEDDPKRAAKWKNTRAVIQFEVPSLDIASHLAFEPGQEVQIAHERHPKPTIAFRFKSCGQLNAFFGGKLAFPKIKGLHHVGLLLRTVGLLFSLKILMPNALPADPGKRAHKVKMVLYMITTALSQLNKGGDKDMTHYTEKMPDRIFQWSVLPDGPAAYLRIKAGKTKAGRGLYQRKRPFVHMKFQSMDGAFAVLAEKKDIVQAMHDKDLVVDGSPEYAKTIGNFMLRIEGLVT
jgi:hypothetical protein